MHVCIYIYIYIIEVVDGWVEGNSGGYMWVGKYVYIYIYILEGVMMDR